MNMKDDLFVPTLLGAGFFFGCLIYGGARYQAGIQEGRKQGLAEMRQIVERYEKAAEEKPVQEMVNQVQEPAKQVPQSLTFYTLDRSWYETFDLNNEASAKVYDVLRKNFASQTNLEALMSHSPWVESGSFDQYLSILQQKDANAILHHSEHIEPTIKNEVRCRINLRSLGNRYGKNKGEIK